MKNIILKLATLLENVDEERLQYLKGFEKRKKCPRCGGSNHTNIGDNLVKCDTCELVRPLKVSSISNEWGTQNEDGSIYILRPSDYNFVQQETLRNIIRNYNYAVISQRFSKSEETIDYLVHLLTLGERVTLYKEKPEGSPLDSVLEIDGEEINIVTRTHL